MVCHARVLPRTRLGTAALPATRPAGAPGSAARGAAEGRPAADGQGGRRRPGDQSQHRPEGVPGSGAPGSRRCPSGRRHLRDPILGLDLTGGTAPCAASSTTGWHGADRPGSTTRASRRCSSRRSGHRPEATSARPPRWRPDGLGLRYRAIVGAGRLHARYPGGPRRRARRRERRRQDHPPEPGERPAPRRPAATSPSSADDRAGSSSSWRRSGSSTGHAHLRGAVGATPPAR